MSVPKKNTFKKRSLSVFSRHPSHAPLRNSIFHPERALVRFGSTTVPQTKYRVEINMPEAVRNSASKLRMKHCFQKAGVITPEWGEVSRIGKIEDKGICFNDDSSGHKTIEFPVVVKHIFGSRGRGNYKLDTKEQMKQWLAGKTLANYIVESFYSYNREYRLHINELGCYYTCRKMLKNETDDEKRWYRNDSNSVWIVEQNKMFQKPNNWDNIVAESVKALKAVGLDFGAVDVRVQGKDKNGNERKSPEFVIIEINSAPGLGKVGLEVYKKMLPVLIDHKLKTKSNGN